MSSTPLVKPRWTAGRLSFQSVLGKHRVAIAPWPDLSVQGPWLRMQPSLFPPGMDPSLPFPPLFLRQQAWGTEFRLPGERWQPASAEVLAGYGPLERFAAHVPLEQRRLIAPFPGCHIRLLRLLRAGPAARQLMRDNPATALLFALHLPTRQTIRSLLARPRTQGVSSMGWPSPRSAVRFLARVPIDALSYPVMDRLETLWARPEWAKGLRHARNLNGTALRALAADRFDLLAPGIVNSMAGAPLRPWDRIMEELSARILRSDLLPVEGCVKSIGDLEQMIGALGAAEGRGDWVMIAGERHRVMPKAIGCLQLPPPPLPGSATIEPLDTPAKLRRESLEMRNCADSYMARIAAGRSYLYRLLAPERLTFELVSRVLRCGKTIWSFAEARGRDNTDAGETGLSAIHQWLSREGR